MSGSMATEPELNTSLKGMPDNPARDPKRRVKEGKGSMGDVALQDAIIIVVLAWAFLIFLAVSLRNHNI